MADRYAELRAALDAGPTPGPWEGRTGGLDCGLDTDCAIYTWERCIAQIPDNPLNQRDMAYIAACHPEAIRALLAERDVFADVLEAIASIKATPGRVKADALLASVVKLARAALAQGES